MRRATPYIYREAWIYVSTRVDRWIREETSIKGSLSIMYTYVCTYVRTYIIITHLYFNNAHTPCSHTTDEGNSQLSKRLMK